jgi:AraC-like DNA-binding protein/CheY-like chemotaxis protein
MEAIFGNRRERYVLVGAAHELILRILPFRHPQSREALARFMRTAAGIRLRRPDLDAVLLQTLAALNPHTKGRLPTLVERYLRLRQNEPDPVQRFGACVLDVIRYRGVGSAQVQRAIAIIEEEYDNPRLAQESVADRLNLSPVEFSILFARHTGATFTAFLRDVRLDRAAQLLAVGGLSIKEIWAQVGFNEASNFTHQFKNRFGVSPREYRSSVICSAEAARKETSTTIGGHESSSHPLLIVEDNDETREQLTRHFQHKGYSVTATVTGEEAFRAATRVTPAAIVIDQHLPDTEGIEWLRAYRQFRPGTDPAAVLFTADLDVDDESPELQRLGATFVSKLCDLEEVQMLVESVLTLHGRGSSSTAGPAG